MKIIIASPYIEERGDNTRLCSNITTNTETLQLWVEVPKEYGEYFCNEVSDSFLVSLLPWAMMKSKQGEKLMLVCEQKISAQLLYQLKTYYIPILAKNIEYYSEVEIVADKSDTIFKSKHVVATGISGGVDSSYTIAKHTNCDNSRYNLTHGVRFNMGFYDGFDGETETFLTERSKKIAEINDLTHLTIKSNICLEIYKVAEGPIVPMLFMGTAMSLQKLFSVYYFSAAYDAKDFYWSQKTASYFDLFTVSCLSTESLVFYSTGSEVTRIEKVAYISSHDFTYDNLSVCTSPNQKQGNCGKCAECTVTMAELDACGKLDLYNNSFNIEAYKKDFDYHWGYIFMKSTSCTHCIDIMKWYKKEGRKLPLSTYFSALKKWAKRGFTADNKNYYKVHMNIR